MITALKRSINYSQRVRLNLQEYLQQNLHINDDHICLAITGSFAKDQGTPGSDIDLLAITDDSHHTKQIKQLLEKALKTNLFTHAIEFYPFQTLDAWRKIIKYSLLYCSDLHFAQPVWGNHHLFDELIKKVKNNNHDLNNQINYVVYNILYRDRQYQRYVKSPDLKYQPGGWRDMQFIKWVAFRRSKKLNSDPLNYLKGLVEINYIDHNQYLLLCQYFEAIIDYKWELETKSYHTLRLIILPIIEQLKKRLLSEFEKELGSNWRRIVDQARTGGLTDLEIKSIINQSNQTENMIFCATWSTNDQDLLTIIYNNWKRYWSVRMALANNPSLPKTIGEQLMDDLSDENSDVRKILSQQNH